MKTIGFVFAPKLVTRVILKLEDNQESCQVSGRKEQKIANMSEIKDEIKNMIFLDDTTRCGIENSVHISRRIMDTLEPMLRDTCLVFNSKVLFVL